MIKFEEITASRQKILQQLEKKLDLEFKNIKLLNNALTHTSYSNEKGKIFDSNERLEFLGDAVLELASSTYLFENFTGLAEGELTKIRASIVCQQTLAKLATKLDIGQVLLLGHGEEMSGGRTRTTNLEDTFEAIIGAVAADCNWDYPLLEKVCKTMLQMETVNNYLTVLVKEKSHALGFGEPVYRAGAYQGYDGNRFNNMFNIPFNPPMGFTSKNPKTGLHEYWVDIGDNKFKGTGDGTFQAKLDADKKAYHFLCQEEIKRNFQNLDFSNPASTLHELIQKKVIMEVRYEFTEYHDENGNPIWNCKAFLEGYGQFSAENISKKQVKQDVSLKLLRFITDTVIEKSDKWEIAVRYSGLIGLE